MQNVCRHLDFSKRDTFYLNQCQTEFQKFAAHAGAWANHWDEPLAPAVTEKELNASTKNIDLSQVSKSITKHGGSIGRLRWFEAYAPHSKLFCRVTEPLLSVCTAGSIGVERTVEPLKNSILTKERNQFDYSKAGVLMRASENLKILMKIKTSFKDQCA